MGYKQQQAPGNLDTDGLRKFTQEQLLRIQRATEESDGNFESLIDALTARITALEENAVGQCKFVYVDATHCKLIPFNGNQIKINGQLYSIPAAGVTITNAGLGAGTIYYCYATISGGSLTLVWASTGHTTSATTGNVGTEIVIGQDAFTLVGMVCTDGAGVFQDNIAQRQVRSWFNETGVVAYVCNSSTNPTVGPGTWTVIPGTTVGLLTWKGEQVIQEAIGQATNSGAGNVSYLGTMIGASPNPSYSFHHVVTVGYYQNMETTQAYVLGADALNTFSAGMITSAGTGTYSIISTKVTTERR